MKHLLPRTKYEPRAKVAALAPTPQAASPFPTAPKRSKRRPIRIDTHISLVGRDKFEAIRMHLRQTSGRNVTGSEVLETCFDIAHAQLGL